MAANMCSSCTECYKCSKVHHSHTESELKSIWEEFFYVTKKSDELDLISYYIVEDVWLLGISEISISIILRGTKRPSISDIFIVQNNWILVWSPNYGPYLLPLICDASLKLHYLWHHAICFNHLCNINLLFSYLHCRGVVCTIVNSDRWVGDQ